jgi:hypothetical protein
MVADALQCVLETSNATTFLKRDHRLFVIVKANVVRLSSYTLRTINSTSRAQVLGPHACHRRSGPTALYKFFSSRSLKDEFGVLEPSLEI